jgi:hypothetical protein
MKTIDEFKAHQFQIVLILLEANQNIKDIEVISDLLEDTNPAFQHRYNQIFNRIGAGIWSHLILQLGILSEKDGSYSLRKFLNKMMNDYNSSEWKDRIEKSELLSEIGLLSDEVLNKQEIQLKMIRDEHYAHLDANRKPYEISTDEIKKVVAFYGDIINRISKKILGTEHEIKTYQIQKYKDLILDLKEFTKIKYGNY